ncbi:hypothetical protein EBY67_03535 [bacterium]|nr:hypothetical protein [bacterium]
MPLEVDRLFKRCYNTHIDSKEQTMITVAKMTDGRVVEIVRAASKVGFSPDRGWIMICCDFEKAYRKRTEFKWVPADTKFEWVRAYAFG